MSKSGSLELPRHLNSKCTLASALQLCKYKRVGRARALLKGTVTMHHKYTLHGYRQHCALNHTMPIHILPMYGMCMGIQWGTLCTQWCHGLAVAQPRCGADGHHVDCRYLLTPMGQSWTTPKWFRLNHVPLSTLAITRPNCIPNGRGADEDPGGPLASFGCTDDVLTPVASTRWPTTVHPCAHFRAHNKELATSSLEYGCLAGGHYVNRRHSLAQPLRPLSMGAIDYPPRGKLTMHTRYSPPQPWHDGGRVATATLWLPSIVYLCRCGP